MAWCRSRTDATQACAPASSSTCASCAATSTTFTAKWITAARDAGAGGAGISGSPAAHVGSMQSLRAKRMGTRPYCRRASDGDRMSIRRTPYAGAGRAWIGLGFASVTGFAMAAGPAAPDAGASATATELDRVVVTATRQADDALLVPAAVDVVGAEELHRARPGLSLSESLQRVDRKSTRLNSSHVKISYAVFCLKKKKHMHTDNWYS